MNLAINNQRKASLPFKMFSEKKETESKHSKYFFSVGIKTVFKTLTCIHFINLLILLLIENDEVYLKDMFG